MGVIGVELIPYLFDSKPWFIKIKHIAKIYVRGKDN